MATNPMKRRERNAALIGALIAFAIMGLIVFLIYVRYTKAGLKDYHRTTGSILGVNPEYYYEINNYVAHQIDNYELKLKDIYENKKYNSDYALPKCYRKDKFNLANVGGIALGRIGGVPGYGM